MPSKLGPDDYDLTIKFGGGLHTRAAEDDIADREAADGRNFTLDLERRELRPRAPFDLVGTAPNGAAIRGGGSLLKSDGAVKAFFQAGTAVYAWDGVDFSASPVLDTVSSSARLRAHFQSHAWPLDDKILITDLGLVEVVKEWDGTTWQDVGFLSNPSTAFGTFYAKYLHVADERALFANIRDPSDLFPHMIVGSARGDYQTLSVDDRPSSALSEQDPFFLLAPDLKSINGLVGAFGSEIVSTEHGQMFNLTGASAKDFAFADFYPGSAAVGAEAVAYIGNDVVYGRRGRMESVRDTDRFGDSEADDLTRKVADAVATYTGWTVVYNSRINRVYAFPTGVSEIWVFETAMRDEAEVSPWMRWSTTHEMAFQPTFVAAMLDPIDGLEYIFMGDTDGNVYRLEGAGTEGDGGTSNIATEFLTKLFSLPLGVKASDLAGYIKYRKDVENSFELVFEYAGESIYNQTITIDVPAAEGSNYFGGDVYYSGDFYYGSIAGRFARQPIWPSGEGNEFQVRVKCDSADAFAISEIGLRLRGAG